MSQITHSTFRDIRRSISVVAPACYASYTRQGTEFPHVYVRRDDTEFVVASAMPRGRRLAALAADRERIRECADAFLEIDRLTRGAR